MAQGPDRRYMTHTQAEAAGVDVGLRSYMLRVYNYMALGVAFTGALAMIVATNQALVQTVSSLIWVFFIAILGLGFFAPRIMTTKSVAAAQACFWVYAALWGILLGPIFYVYAQMDPMIIVRAFFITAATFAGMSLVGYTTKKDLSGLGTFFMMASIGILVAILINVFFVQSTLMSLITSIGVVLLFSGITAYETQQIKTMYSAGDMGDVVAKKAIFGAYMLYGTFVVLFIHVLNILGIMRE
ncbi:Bax inhibitor-1/YccA family protein [Ferruginivarius sediminum]|uniref:BAX inhibitor (BI)-1/YccA family protein n=1 Tax=Ferruginivarius sediminum TaxID=2661937 RepID=A0A369TDH7_9PROT|nr:Bax inhibitor-1/YccA family protein [Ferruginivarius sediminum]RDD63401.1 BAX inhibitor (BI)-1/YccA family protein [Ferruginivarius sediminum]